MANSKKEMLDELDEDLRNIKSGVDAARMYTATAMRIADALEHLNIQPTLQFLALPSEEFPAGRETDLYITGHLASCPSCTMIRKARKIDPKQIMRALGAMNGGKIIGG